MSGNIPFVALRDRLPWAKKPVETRQATSAIAPWSHYVDYPRQPVTGPAVISEGAMLQLPWAWRCIVLLSGLVRQMPVLNRRTREPAQGLWRRPTVELGYTTADLLDQTTATLLIHGVAYWRILEWDSRGRPMLIMPLHPDQVFVFNQADTLGRLYRLAGIDGEFTDQEMIQLRGPALVGSIVPISPLRAAARTIAVATHEQETAKIVLEDGGIPRGYLSSPTPLSPEYAQAQAERWYQFQGGRRSATAVLDGGTKWETVSLSAAELELVASRRLSAIEQCAIFGVPPHLVGAPAEGHSLTYSNVTQDIAALYRTTLGRWTSAIEQAVRPYGLDIRLDETDLVRPSQSERWSSYSTALADGWLTVDEVRDREGLPPLPATIEVEEPEVEVEEPMPGALALVESRSRAALP